MAHQAKIDISLLSERELEKLNERVGYSLRKSEAVLASYSGFTALKFIFCACLVVDIIGAARVPWWFLALPIVIEAVMYVSRAAMTDAIFKAKLRVEDAVALKRGRAGK